MHVSFLFFTLFASIGVLAQDSLFYDPETEILDDNGCDWNFENLSVGKTVSAKNYVKFKKENKLFILGISDSTCEKCCGTEPLLKALDDEFKAKNYMFRKNSIKIARIDYNVAKHREQLSRDGIRMDLDRAAIYISFDGRYYLYDNRESKEVFLNILNRIIHPLLPLANESEVEKFLDLKQEPIETTKFFKKKPVKLDDEYLNGHQLYTRVMVFCSDEQEWAQELTDIKTAMRTSIKRIELRAGLVTDVKLIKRYKNRYGNLWFTDDVQLNSLVVKRYDGQFFGLDMLDIRDVQTPQFYVNKKSMDPVQLMTHDALVAMELVGQSILVAFVDFESSDKEVKSQSLDLVNNVLPEVAPAVFKAITVAYTHIQSAESLAGRMGLTQNDKLPVLAVHNDGAFWRYPEDKKFEVDPIRSFVTSYLKGNLDKNKMGGEVKDDTLDDLVPDFRVVDDQQLREIIRNEGRDLIILSYTSRFVIDEQRDILKHFNKVAKAFKQEKVKSVDFLAYDINKYGVSNHIHDTADPKLPALDFQPAFDRKSSPRHYSGSAELSDVVKFIKKNADIKIENSFSNIDMQIDVESYMKKQKQEEQAKVDYMKKIEDELKRRGEL